MDGLFNNVPPIQSAPALGTVKLRFTAGEETPTKIDNTISPRTEGQLLVSDNPYAAVTDANGRVKLTNLPTGKWNFQLWHERCGFIKEATLGSEQVEFPRGRIEWEIEPGEKDLGDLLVKPAVFKE
jgi:hypothetical protein